MKRCALHAGRWDAVLRIAVSLFGTLLTVLLGAAFVARALPMSPDTRFALAFVCLVPAWVVAMCLSFLARSGVRALLVCVVAGVLLAVLRELVG